MPPSNTVSARTNSARRCAAAVETIKIPSPEAAGAESSREGVSDLVNGRLNPGIVGWAKARLRRAHHHIEIGGLNGGHGCALCPPYDNARLTPRRAASSACGVSMSRNAPWPSTGDFGHGFGVLGDQMAGADIAVERHQFPEEAPRPQHRIAAAAVADGHRDQMAAIRRKGLDQMVDQLAVDQRHVAEADDGAVGLVGHRARCRP